jgi:hypothetical protein
MVQKMQPSKMDMIQNKVITQVNSIMYTRRNEMEMNIMVNRQQQMMELIQPQHRVHFVVLPLMLILVHPH